MPQHVKFTCYLQNPKFVLNTVLPCGGNGNATRGIPSSGAALISHDAAALLHGFLP